MVKTVCNCCGRTYHAPETDICETCHEPMCAECFRDYAGACCVDPPRPSSRSERLHVKVIQSLYALRQLTKRKAKHKGG